MKLTISIFICLAVLICTFLSIYKKLTHKNPDPFSYLNSSSTAIYYNKFIIEEDLQAYTFFPTDYSSPALLIIEGSYNQISGQKSILRLFKYFEKIITDLNCGLIFMEKRGVKPEYFDKRKFHKFNTPSQRLCDHLLLVDYLKKNPPIGWNRDLIILGGSEGGSIAIKLSKETSPSACIVLAGCGNQTFKQLIWHTIQNYQSSNFLKNKLISWWYCFPKNYPDFENLCQKMKEDPNPKKWWFGQTYLYWSDALDQEEKTDFLELNCPILVVAGSDDLQEPFTQNLIRQAKEEGRNVTYERIEGMGHHVLEPQWKVTDKIIRFLKRTNTSSARFERTTCCLGGNCSILLSYEDSVENSQTN